MTSAFVTWRRSGTADCGATIRAEGASALRRRRRVRGTVRARIHLEFKKAWELHLPIMGGDALYAVHIIGRQSAHRGRYTPYLADGYPEEIIADRAISLKELEPPVRPGNTPTQGPAGATE